MARPELDSATHPEDFAYLYRDQPRPPVTPKEGEQNVDQRYSNHFGENDVYSDWARQTQDGDVHQGHGNRIRVQDALHFRQSSVPSQFRESSVLGGPPPIRIATLSPPLGQFIINTFLQIAGFAAAIAFGVFAVKSVTVGNNANTFAAKALDEAVIANKLAMLAVCLASANQTGDTQAICSRIIAGAASVLPSAATNIFTSLPTPKSTTSTTTFASTTAVGTSSSSTTIVTSTVSGTLAPIASSSAIPSKMTEPIGHNSTGTIVGATVGSVVALALVGMVAFFVLRRRRMHIHTRAETPFSHAPSQTPQAERPDAMPATRPARPTSVGSEDGGSEMDEKMSVRQRRGVKHRFRELFVDSYVVSR